MPSIEKRLAELGIELPTAKSPTFNYVPYVVAGPLVFVSGQLPWIGDEIRHRGRVGAELTIEQGKEAARLCAINMLAHLRNACDGDLERVARCVKLGGFVNCGPGFADMPKVVDGASELIVALFGEAGRHARLAVGSSGLPRNVAVEIEGVFERR